LKLKKPIGAIIAVGALLWTTTFATAQDGIISEDDFWYRLTLTDLLLGQPSGETVAQVNDLWRDVDGVRMPDETVIRVDVTWVQLSPDSSTADITQVHDRVRALLTFHERFSEDNTQSADRLAALDDVLQRRVHEEKPGPAESDSSSRAVSLSPSLAQMVLIAAGLIVVIVLLGYLWGMLQVQPAAVDLSSDSIPSSSQAATVRAEEYQAAHDYRAAIRQLYLASLLVLDEQQIIRYDAALTNREHLEQLHEQPLVHELMAQVVTIFDRVWYGFAPADETLYRAFRQYLEQLRRFGR
jgi:hypothetical protein